MNRSSRVALCVVASMVLGSGAALGGDLNPPAGPIAPTPGPEPRIAINAANTPGDADSVYRISESGSYYLTGNVAGVVGRCGIEIAASGVTVDLMGFELVGVPGSLDGIRSTVAGLNGIEVRNGTIRSWGDAGLDFYIQSVSGGRIEAVRFVSNTDNGMLIGTNSAAVGCIAEQNGLNGLVTKDSCTITGCSARDNTFAGFLAGVGTTVTACAAWENGFAGIDCSTGCTVSHSAAHNNSRSGIDVGSGSVVLGCAAHSNTIDGIVSGGDGVSIAECSAQGNLGDGIQVDNDSRVVGNVCDGNGSGASDGAGIHVTGTDNRIEGNHCTDADRGIDVDAGGNIIIRNTCAGNSTDWDIVANNVYGPIVDKRLPISAAVNGFAAVSTLGSTDANANYSY